MPVLPNAVLPNNQSGSISQAFGSALQGSVGLSNATSRQNIANMYQYSGNNPRTGVAPVVIYPDASTDWRVRVSLAPGSDYFYNDTKANSLLSPLINEASQNYSNNDNSATFAAAARGFMSKGPGNSSRVGVVFPYTPTVSITHTASYTPVELTHNNYKHYAYNHSEVSAISVSGEFTVQNVNDGQYLLAAIYFFRSCTKMFFGADPRAGNPPPIVYLNGYGQYYLPNVPCVVTSFAHTMPADCDYIDIPEPAAVYDPRFVNYRKNSTRLPTTSAITLSLQPVYSRYAQSQGFSLNDFSAGALVNTTGAGMPASAFGASQQAQYANKGPNAIKGGQNGGFI